MKQDLTQKSERDARRSILNATTRNPEHLQEWKALDACDKLAFRVAALEKDIAIVLKAFDDGIFVWDVSQDHRSDWAVRFARPGSAIGRLAAALGERQP